MTASTTIVFGRSGAHAGSRLPGWTLPFLVRLAGTISPEAANGGPVLSVVAGDRWAPRAKPGTAA
ncbi:hypothetical protein [Phreatobacter stygius]|uniref:Uncharacterized protein n=1 Tax=Phreatobacter stygius TaxID=1940610 RepID=A0A4D7B6E6_9HYPH|nr:hypothetical protein [Phreatobacter stygius]QCI66543.1 hypothetical protein E8M01_21305 [Phreatobacter stygius]